MCGGKNIDKRKGIRGEFFVITDLEKTNMWKTMDEFVVQLGLPSFYNKTKVPASLMLIVGYFLEILGNILGR
jgi:hypothetical protein